ncbi:hypothetical protein GE09DRAFT_1227037 [Coniochaeta sp. 2T2.1]|nr:hypothetical protein GE09DRAFT_1227037 [Coniochaeta sp. 2T2.1]
MSTPQVPGGTSLPVTDSKSDTTHDHIQSILTAVKSGSICPVVSTTRISGNAAFPATTPEAALLPETPSSISNNQQVFLQYARLPTELKFAVWKSLFSEPGINFYNIEVQGWEPKLKRAPAQVNSGLGTDDDSQFPSHRELATAFPEAARELSLMYKKNQFLISKSDGASMVLGKRTDIVCFGGLASLTGSNYLSTNDRTRSMDHIIAQLSFEGLEKVAVLARFIDCCPDIREFFCVIHYEVESTSPIGQTIREWCDNHDMNDLAIYSGRDLQYYEVHRRSAAAPSKCSLSPRCRAPVYIDTRIYKLFDHTQKLLLDEGKHWKLPLVREGQY